MRELMFLAERTLNRSARGLLGLLLCASALPAQSRNIRFDQLSLEQGLSQGTVNCILQDSVGFLWFGTQGGLNRYDGYGFRVYKHDPGDLASLPDNWITALAEDPSGDLWVGTQSGGLIRWHRATDTFSHYRHQHGQAGLTPNRVRALLIDRAGALWVGTSESGLARLVTDNRQEAAGTSGSDPGNAVFEPYRHDPTNPGSLSDDRVRALHEDRDGNLWIGTLDGLNRFDGDSSFVRFQHDPSLSASLSDNRVTSILENHLGDLWVGTEKGLNRSVSDAFRANFVRYMNDPANPASLSHDHVWDIFEDHEKRLWVGTDDGLNLLDGRSGTFSRFRADTADPASLSNNRIMTISQDRGHVIWVGTQGGGLNKSNPITWSFSHFRADSEDTGGLSNNAVFAFSEDAAAKLWVGTFGGGIDVLDRSTGRFIHYKHDSTDPFSLSDNQVAVLLHDRDGVLWAGTAGGGLNHFDPETEKFHHYRHDPANPESLSEDNVASLFEDHDGALWVGTFRGGLNRLGDGAGTFARFRHDPADPRSLSNDFVTAFAEDIDGSLWVATFGGGLDRFDGEVFHHLRHDPGLPSSLSNDSIYTLHVDAAGVLWVGTQVGLNKLNRLGDNITFQHYLEGDGLPSDGVHGIRSDTSGHLWLATNNGLSRFDPKTETFKNYNVSHGLQSNEFNFGAHFHSRTGELFFGGVNGFNAFHPDRIERNTAIPPVVLTAIEKLGEPVAIEQLISADKPLPLSYRDDLLTFEFAALDYTAPEENRYRYKLEGLNDAWIDLGTRRRVTFTNLAPRHYVLHLQGSNNDGAWNEQGTSIRIAVAPPPWMTWWAYTLYGLALATLILGYGRWQHRRVERERAVSSRLREVDKLKNEFLANTSHELRTPLYGITGLAESLADGTRGEVPEAVKRDLSMIAASGLRLSGLVDDILDFSKLKHQGLELRLAPVELHALADIVLTLAKPLAFGKALELENAVSAELPPAEADAGRLQQILHNLIGNAIKFTDQGRVEVSAKIEDQHLVVTVADTGIGVAEKNLERIFESFRQADASTERIYGGTGLGLAISRQLVELHGGRIWAESKVTEGSRFHFSLPIAKQQVAEGAELSVLTHEPPVLEVAEPSRTIAAPDGAFRILVVDDEPMVREVLANHLSAEGYELVLASSGEESLRRLETEPVDLILLDIMMPRMSGYEVCRLIREKQSLEELPVIFLSAKNQTADLVAGFAEGSNDYLTKPITKSELLARVSTHLDLLEVHRRQAEEVLMLRGMLPICCNCKNIRDDKGYWTQIEVYIDRHSEAEFTHGICPGCAEEIYGDIVKSN